MGYTLPARPKPSRKKFFIGVIPDVHVGYIGDTPTYSIAAWDIAMQALRHEVERLTHVVIIGDFGNWESLSHWASLRAEQAFVEEDIALVRGRLAEVFALNDIRPKRMAPIQFVFCEGNHESWASLLEAKYPQMRDTVNLRRRLDFRGPGRLWVPENHFWAIGDIHFTHGHMKGNNKVGDLCLRQGISVVQGHTHALRTASVRTVDRELEQWEMGCLASIDPPPPYTRGALPSAWVHGLGWVRVRSNGAFQVSFSRIFEEAYTELADGTELRVDGRMCVKRYDEDQRIRDRLRAEYSDRFYHTGGPVLRTEPHHGKTTRRGVSDIARTRRARIVRTLPGG